MMTLLFVTRLSKRLRMAVSSKSPAKLLTKANLPCLKKSAIMLFMRRAVLVEVVVVVVVVVVAVVVVLRVPRQRGVIRTKPCVPTCVVAKRRYATVP
eukprot:scaffold41301_cov229-Amphora_coffeaeformis.AAC.1